MRICLIADSSSVHTVRWANHFAARGHEVHIISRRLGLSSEGDYGGITLHWLPKLIPLPQISSVSIVLAFVPWVLQLRTVLRRIKPDIVHALFMGLPGYLGAMTGFHPLLLTAMGSDVLLVPGRSSLHRFVLRRAIAAADGIICVSSAIGDAVIEQGASPHKVTFSLIGVDTRRFSPESRDKSLLEGLDIAGCPVVISTRRLRPVYDLQTLIKAVPLVLNEAPSTKFLIVGDGEQRSYLQDLARDAGAQESARFLGWIAEGDLPRYLASADVYVSTSLSDGTSISLLEALSSGLPAVVSDIPANRPWVEEGRNGFLFAPGDHHMLAHKIVSLIGNATLRTAMGSLSRDIAVSRADYETEMAKVERLYHELTSVWTA